MNKIITSESYIKGKYKIYKIGNRYAIYNGNDFVDLYERDDYSWCNESPAFEKYCVGSLYKILSVWESIHIPNIVVEIKQL